MPRWEIEADDLFFLAPAMVTTQDRGVLLALAVPTPLGLDEPQVTEWWTIAFIKWQFTSEIAVIKMNTG